jgi:hypothetical protein
LASRDASVRKLKVSNTVYRDKKSQALRGFPSPTFGEVF